MDEFWFFLVSYLLGFVGGILFIIIINDDDDDDWGNYDD